MLFIKGYLTNVVLIGLVAVQFAYTVEAIDCVQCGGSGQSECAKALTPTVCKSDISTDVYDRCFTKVDTNGVVSKGCLLLNDTTCTGTNNCKKSTDGTQLVCKTCDTTDADCSQTDMSSKASKYIQICDAGQLQCRINVNNKRVERGCANAAEVTACTDEQTCKVCDTDFCNTGIFPTNRRYCYQCNGSTCNDVTANQKSTPCLNFIAADQCYTIGESATAMKRGCQSDESTNANPNECLATKDGCLFCSADNCNNLKYRREQTRKCHQCTGNTTTTECFKVQSSGDYKNCQNQIAYNDTEYCYTNVDGDSIERGCLYDNTKLTEDNCKDDGVCTKCSDADGCNNKAVSVQFTCIRCRSDEEEKCWNDAGSLTGTKCRSGDSSAEEGCFHGIWNGVVIRGCMIDADEQQKYICKDVKNEQCRTCNKKDCNTDESSAANTIKMYFGLWLMVLTTLWYFK